jgi:hypothetical protein
MAADFPSCERPEVVMQRIAVELGDAACELAAVEGAIAGLIESRDLPADLDHFQALDRIGQKLRTLEAFLLAASSCSCGRIDVEAALDEVWLEQVRSRLSGAPSVCVHAAVPAEPVDVELW